MCSVSHIVLVVRLSSASGVSPFCCTSPCRTIAEAQDAPSVVFHISNCCIFMAR